MGDPIDLLLNILAISALFILPAAAVVRFIKILLNFRKLDRSDAEEYKKQRNNLILESIPAGIIAAALVGLILLIFLGLLNM